MILRLTLLSAISHVAGAAAYAWWIRPDIKELRNRATKLERENDRYRKYILRDFKFMVVRNGVEVDPDE
jgi:hypothetical protein